VNDREDLLIGSVLLGRAMLGDQTIVDPAKAFLSPANNRTDKNGVLGRHSAVTALGLTGSPEAATALADCWDLGYHIGRETAVAMSFCQNFDAADHLVGVMNGKGKPEAKALAARCLGDLLSRKYPSPLSRLSNGTNYMMRTPRMTLYQGIANEFLYAYLIAPSADDWEILNAQED
jgi:hypothetical protein